MIPLPGIALHTFLQIDQAVTKILSWNEITYQQLAEQLFKETGFDRPGRGGRTILSLRTEGRSGVTVLQLLFEYREKATFIIRVYSTNEEAEREEKIAKNLCVADCFPHLIPREHYNPRNLVVYRHVSDQTGSDVVEIYRFLSENWSKLSSTPTEIFAFASTVQKFVRVITKKYQEIEGRICLKRVKYYYDEILLQLPPDLIIKDAYLEDVATNTFVTTPSSDQNKPLYPSPLPVTPISDIFTQQFPNHLPEWLKTEVYWFDTDTMLLTGKGKTAYLPLDDEDKKFRIWVGIPQERGSKLDVKLGKKYELVFRREDITTFTNQLQKIGFTQPACLPNHKLQQLLLQYRKDVPIIMCHNDLHCGNVLVSALGHLKAIDLGDMKQDLVASDIARLEVSLWYEISKQLGEQFSKEDAETILRHVDKEVALETNESRHIVVILSQVLRGLRKCFDDPEIWYEPNDFEKVLAYVIQILLWQRYCLLDGVEKIPPAFDVFACYWLEKFRFLSKDKSGNVSQPMGPVTTGPNTAISEVSSQETTTLTETEVSSLPSVTESGKGVDELRQRVQNLRTFLVTLTESLKTVAGGRVDHSFFKLGKEIGSQIGSQQKVNKRETELSVALEVVRQTMGKFGMSWPCKVIDDRPLLDSRPVEPDKQRVELQVNDCLAYPLSDKLLCQLRHGVFCGLFENIYGAKTNMKIDFVGNQVCLLELEIQKK